MVGTTIDLTFYQGDRCRRVESEEGAMNEPSELRQAFNAYIKAVGDHFSAGTDYLKDKTSDECSETRLALEDQFIAHDRLAAEHAALVAAARAYLYHTDTHWSKCRDEDGKLYGHDAYEAREAELAGALYNTLPKEDDR